MPEIEFPHKFPALFVRSDSPAAQALMRILNTGKPAAGAIHFITDEELASLKEDVVALEV